MDLSFAARKADRPSGRKHGDFLSRAEADGLTPAELTCRTTALALRMAEFAPEAERLRRPTDERWAALRASGYFYQFVPRAFGGMATDLESFINATLPISEAYASTGWAAAFRAGHNRTLAYFPEEFQAELWEDQQSVAPPPSPFPCQPVLSCLDPRLPDLSRSDRRCPRDARVNTLGPRREPQRTHRPTTWRCPPRCQPDPCNTASDHVY